MNNGTTAGTKLGVLIKRQSEIKDALKEIQRRRRAQEKTDRLRLEAEIGAAILADAESASGGGRRAYIIEVLDRTVTSEITRAFLRSKGWLGPAEAIRKQGNAPET